MRNLALCVSLTLLFCLGCRKEEAAGEVRQVTARPETPPPPTASENDTALTQTVEIGEERSADEGGVLTNGASQRATTSTVPVSNAATRAAAPKSKKH